MKSKGGQEDVKHLFHNHWFKPLLRNVANSPYTVLGESYSAGRLYDKIEEEAQGKIKFILDKGVVCELVE